MSDRQRDAFEQLVVRGDLTRDHKFQEGYNYSTDLKQVLRKAGQRDASGNAGGQPAQLYQPVPEVIALLQKKGFIPL